MNDPADLELCKAKLLGNHSDNIFPGHELILLAREYEMLPLAAAPFV